MKSTEWRDNVIFFDESVSEYKYVLLEFCFECMSSLLRFLSRDLYRITPRKLWKQ